MEEQNNDVVLSEMKELIEKINGRVIVIMFSTTQLCLTKNGTSFIIDC